MAGSGTYETNVAGRGRGRKIAIVASSWHDSVMRGLMEGAQRGLQDAGAQHRLIRVPGSFELPLATQNALKEADGVVALGVVIRGGTAHFDYVCSGVTNGLMRVMLDTGKPVGFGVLTCDNEAQALDRAGFADSHEDKGYEAAVAVVEMLATLEE